MRHYVSARTSLAVSVEEVPDIIEEFHNRTADGELPRCLEVLRKELKNGCQVGSRPSAVHVAFRKADVATGQCTFGEGKIMNVDNGTWPRFSLIKQDNPAVGQIELK